MTAVNTKRFSSRAAFLWVVVWLAACHGKHDASVDIRPVRTAVVGTGQYGNEVTYTGEVRARHESDLGFQVAGKLIARPAEVGASVLAGAVLAHLFIRRIKLGQDRAREYRGTDLIRRMKRWQWIRRRAS